jgi:hypothetical protein
MGKKFDDLLSRLEGIEALLTRLVVEAEKPLPPLDEMLEATRKAGLKLHNEIDQQHRLERLWEGASGSTHTVGDI